MKILIVDPDQRQRREYRRTFDRAPAFRRNRPVVSVIPADLGDAPDLVLGDPVDITCGEWLERMRSYYPDAYVMIATRRGDVLSAENVRTDARCIAITKPFYPEELSEVIECVVMRQAEIVTPKNWQ